MELTERQQRELDYHRDYAAKHASILEKPVNYEVLKGGRWWNQYWEFYDLIRREDLSGKRVLIVGCGFDADPVLVAKLGGEVYAFDLSQESVELGNARARREGFKIDYRAMPAERTDYPENFFDVVIARDILHHVDIPATVRELTRVCKPGARWVVNEIYSHTWTDTVRKSAPVQKVLYPLLQGFVYGGKDPYITEDERKLTQADIRAIVSPLKDVRYRWFYAVANRLFPDTIKPLAKLDRLMLKVFSPLGGVLAGRVMFTGTLRKD